MTERRVASLGERDISEEVGAVQLHVKRRATHLFLANSLVPVSAPRRGPRKESVRDAAAQPWAQPSARR